MSDNKYCIYSCRLNYMLFACLVVFSVVFSGCRKNEFDMDKLSTSGDWNPDVALPLIYSSLNMEDILADYKNHNIEMDNSNLCYLVYKNEVVSGNAESLIIIPDQNINTTASFSVPGNSLPAGQDFTTNVSKVYTFIYNNGESIDSMYIKSGMMNFNIMSDVNYDATVVVTLPAVKLNGAPFTQSFDIPAGGNPFISLNLDGYTMEFGAGTLGENQISIQYDITLHGNGSPNNSPYNINFNEYLSNLHFGKIFGYFGQFQFDITKDTLNIKLYNNNLSGIIDYEDPRIYLKFTSTIGMPLGIYPTEFEAKPSHDSPTSVAITGLGVPTASAPYILQAVPFYMPGHMVSESVYLDRNNSTMYNAMLISPRYFYSKPVVKTNPAGVSQNFALDTSRLAYEMKVELPMHGKAWDFILQDTIPFEFESIDELEYLQFNIDVVNQYPVDGIAQIYFADSSYNVLDSLLTPLQSVIIAATPGPAPDYLVSQPVRKYTTTTFNESRLKHLKGVKYMFIWSHLDSHNSGNNIVKIYSFYNIDVKISARAKFRVSY